VVHYTTSCNSQSVAPEDGRDQGPKHVELIGIKKPLLLHLVGVYIIYINDVRSNKYQICTSSQNVHFSAEKSVVSQIVHLFLFNISWL